MRRFVTLAALAVLAAAPVVSCSASPDPTPPADPPAASVAAPLLVAPGTPPAPAVATPTTFAAGSLIIPMDIDYQNAGALRAFGLLYKLLHSDVPVSWCVLDGKSLYTGSTPFPASPGNSVDFTASAVDVATNAVITSHGYRGGPFVIDAAHAAAALPIVTAWNAASTTKVAVHKATASFTAPVSRSLLNAPNIGINNDGNAPIAIGYLNAAGIPDSSGAAWTTSSKDVLTPTQVAGPSLTNNHDGALFGKNGNPVYCQFMSMHWTVQRNATNDAAVAEMRQYLQFPTHLFAECQAVNMIEDDDNGHFVASDNGTGEPSSSVACFKTPDDGLCAGQQPSTFTFLHSDLPFAQLDGPFKSVGGSEPGYGLAPGSHYYDTGIVMIRNGTASDFGVDDLWMTGIAGGSCAITDPVRPATNCNGIGKVSYLGGHQYTTNLPLTSNPTTQGTRLFLNSLFEAGCVTTEGQPAISLVKVAPSSTATAQLTFEIDWSNAGPGVAVGAVVTDALPAGTTFVSATSGGTFAGGTVTWKLNDLGPGDSGALFVTVGLSAQGTYKNQATIAFTVGNNAKSLSSNETSTVYCVPAASCPASANCGSIADGCGGTVSCGPACPTGQACGAGGTPNVCGQGTCTPNKTCPPGASCGTIDDGCGGTIQCGPADGGAACTAPNSCGGGGTPNVCGCTPLAACPSPDDCGSIDDGCGGKLACGPDGGTGCTGNATCGGGGTPNVCGTPACVPLTACPAADDCGTIDDGCGGMLSCGTCGSAFVCAGNACTGCTPLAACPAPANCGVMPDGCGGTVDCGASCGGTDTCGGGGASNVCGSSACTRMTACPAADDCGTISDGCGGVLVCGGNGGNCPGGQLCVANVCGGSAGVDGGAGDGGAAGDGGTVGDAGAASDAGASVDAGAQGDGGASLDAGTASDSGGAQDAATSGVDAAGPPDGGGTLADAGGGKDGGTTPGGSGDDGGGGAAATPGENGGCGCHTANAPSVPPAPVAAFGALVGLVAFRRRRTASRRRSA